MKMTEEQKVIRDYNDLEELKRQFINVKKELKRLEARYESLDIRINKAKRVGLIYKGVPLRSWSENEFSTICGNYRSAYVYKMVRETNQYGLCMNDHQMRRGNGSITEMYIPKVLALEWAKEFVAFGTVPNQAQLRLLRGF
jgi:hypothetical protein